jgi:hypothetical protein
VVFHLPASRIQNDALSSGDHFGTGNPLGLNAQAAIRPLHGFAGNQPDLILCNT